MVEENTKECRKERLGGGEERGALTVSTVSFEGKIDGDRTGIEERTEREERGVH